MLRRSVVLLSGGLDSATVLAIVRERRFHPVHALSFNYGQKHALELECARRLAEAADASHWVVRVQMPWSRSALTSSRHEVPKGRSGDEIARGIPSTYVPARNTIFLSYALSLAESVGALDIFAGMNALDYSGYPDCRPEFVESFQATARLGTKAGIEGGGVTVHAPLVCMTKAEIIREGVRLGVDYGSTLSCYDPSESGGACGACDSCQLRARGFREAGVADPAARAA
jgi:7-cyano-7-deazaguanine synthase